MTVSMTAFAYHDVQSPWGVITWELRSVNHRFLDIAVRLPDDLRSLEDGVRKRISREIRRGRVDCTLRFKPDASQKTSIRINHALVAQLATASRTVAHLLNAEGAEAGGPAAETNRSAAKPSGAAIELATLNPLDILRWPGVVESPDPDIQALAPTLLTALETAVAELAVARAREGQKLTELLTARCEAMETVVGEVRRMLPGILTAHGERLRSRLGEVQAELDPNRLEQEMVIFAQKTDVAEELDRLDTHLAEVRRTLTEKKPVGRRLDFLMQELHREASTLSAKSVASKLTSATVELRVLIEQMREQVQNIE